jgi:hypothetical protein
VKPEDIPDFLFRGAIVSVDGVERVLKDLCLAIPEDSPRFRKEDQVLVLQFKDGLIVQYDPDRVKEVHGCAPDFIRAGEKIFWRAERGDMQKYNGVWEIEAYRVVRDECQGLPKTQVELSLRRKKDATSTYLTQKFNAKTMFPVRKEEEPANDDLPSLLKKNVRVLKPIRFKKGGGPKTP